MDRAEVVGKIVEAVRQLQEVSGREVGTLGPGTRPLGDVKGFDSLSGIEATVTLSELLDQDLPDSVFVSEDGRHALSVSEIADKLCAVTGIGVQGK